jgi:Lysophospholipase L1 and related esterases
MLLATKTYTTHAQTAAPFANEIAWFKKQDSIKPTPRKPILFIGSSSFTNWKDVQDYFPGYPILNRGFGGSSLPHLLLYADEIIFPYNPKQIVIYCGENDFGGGPHITADSILTRFKRLHDYIRSKMPKVPIVYISMKPSPFRQKVLPQMQAANELIKAFANRTKRLEYIDVYSHMLNADGSIREDIFLSDKLHMNKQGYAIWQPLIAPYLRR